MEAERISFLKVDKEFNFTAYGFNHELMVAIIFLMNALDIYM